MLTKIILLLVISFCITTQSFGKVVLYRYYDTATGEERGICYGHTPPVDNPAWDVEIIDEKLKKHYMTKHKRELRIKEKIRKEEKKAKKDKAKKELEDLGISDATIENILN